MSKEELSANTSEGCIAGGLHVNVIAGGVATRTLLAKESGSLCLFDRAAGVTYTLPTPVLGMYFDFMPSILTSGTYKVVTADTATQDLAGTIFGYTTDATEIDGFVAGATDSAIAHNGTTTGGDAGGRYTLTAISTTKWLITGNMYCGTASPSTPFAAS